ncbi:MAG: YigZ family protein [Gammaproteobacteria bacterium MedPE]|nr:MAG: YigZ family protein [Gammaproteobacteria bacterium MedPE]
MNTQPYRVLSAPLMVQTDVKRSKFLAYVAPTQGIEAAKAFIQQIKLKHPDASHNCSAFVAGRPENTVDIGYSDDGEPSGCAGRPMLNVLQGSGVGEITVVVTRYFGGTKLGTGGMARAYGAAVSAVLAEIETKEKSVSCELAFSCDYQWTTQVEMLVNQFDVIIVSANYHEGIDYTIEIDVRQREEFAALIHQRTNGQVSIDLT